MTLQVTHAAPHPQGVPLHPTVGVAEAVVTTTMAAVPGMDMAVVTVIPAVGVTRTPLIVVTDRVGRSGDRPLLKEAILVNTAARAVGHLGVVAAAAVGQIEEWPGADTEKRGGKWRNGFSLRLSKDFKIQRSALLNSGLQASV